MFVSFINVFTQIHMVSCQGVYTIWCRSFCVKPAFFNELYLTLQTDFGARWYFFCQWLFFWIGLPTPDIDYEEEWWQYTPLSVFNTHGERLWFIFADTDANFCAGIQWLWPVKGGCQHHTPTTFQKLYPRDPVICFLTPSALVYNIYHTFKSHIEHVFLWYFPSILQDPNSPVYYGRELFKHSKGAANLRVCNEKTNFLVLGFWFLWVTSWVEYVFSRFSPGFLGPTTW